MKEGKKFYWFVPALLILFTASYLATSLRTVDDQGIDPTSGNMFNPGNGMQQNELTAGNNYTGAGSPLSLMEWADSTNTTEGVSLIDSETPQADVRLAEGWTGYALNTYVYDLFETDSWVDYHSFAADSNQGDLVNNGVWNYGEDPADGTPEIGGEVASSPQYVWVDLNDDDRSEFENGDRAWWEQAVDIPRGEIDRAWIVFDYWTGNWDGRSRCPYADFNVYAEVEGSKIFDIPSPDMGPAGSWSSSGIYELPQSVVNNFPTMPGTIDVRIGAYCASSWTGTRYNMYARFDNVRFFVKAKARPTDVNLRMDVDNDTAGARVIPDSDYGSGELFFNPTPSNWTAGASPADIYSTFSTNSTTDFPGDGLEVVEFTVDQTIFGTFTKQTTTEPNLLSGDGANFSVENSTEAHWTTFFYDRPPQIPLQQEDYINYKFNGTKPSDWTIYSIIDSQPVEKIAFLTGAGSGSSYIEMPESQAAYYGFWSISVNSPNYVESFTINDTDIYEGDVIQLDGSIISSPLTDPYISQTEAMLTIKLPNQTVWLTQQVSVAGDRSISFSPITIPTSGNFYIAGEYTAILSWNNSYGGNPLYEVGLHTLTFTVKHRADLVPKEAIIYDVLDSETTLPVQLRYADIGGNPIENANITFTNFNSIQQSFNSTSGFYNYLTLLDCQNGVAGLNDLVITAEHPSYETKIQTVQVEIVKLTKFSIDEFPSISVEWNDNFTLTLNYTELNSGNPIEISSETNITVDWPEGVYSVDMSQATSGIYTLEFNSSGALPGNSYTVPINIKEIGYQGKTVVMDISVTPVLSSLTISPISSISFGEMLATIVTFKETATQAGIDNSSNAIQATARILETSTPCGISGLGGGQYNITLDTWLLSNLGVFTLEVNFSWSGEPYYANQSKTLVFDVIERPTNTFASGTYAVQSWGDNFTILVTFSDSLNDTSISSSVTITIDAYDGVTSLSQVNTETWWYFDAGNNSWALEFNASHFLRTNLNPGFLVNVDFNWTSGLAPYYLNDTISFRIKIDEAPTFLYIEDPSSQTAPAGATHNVTFVWINQRTGSGIDNSEDFINLTRSGSLVTSPVFDHATNIQPLGNGRYELEIDINSLAGNFISFNISINRTNFQNIDDYSFTLIKIAQVPVAEIINIDRVHLYQEMNFTIFYHLQGSSSGISGAEVNVSNGPTSGVWDYPADYDYSFNGTYYNITFTPSFTHSEIFSEGAFAVFINFSSGEGQVQLRVNFNVDPIPSNISRVYFDSVEYTDALPTISAFVGDTIDLDIFLEDTYNSSAIPWAMVTINLGAWNDVLPYNSGTENYSLTLDTSIFGTGPAIFTIVASKGNYTQSSKQIKIDILSVSTDLELLLDGANDSTIQLYYGENFTVSALYNDTHNIQNITDPGVALSLTGGASAITAFSLGFGDYWEAEINSSVIGTPGTYSMTLSAGLIDYQTAITTFVVSILQIPTELIAYNSSGQLENSYTRYWGETLDIAVIYNNTIIGQNITGATVATTGSITNSSYTVDEPWYNFTFDTATFGTPSVYTITLSASRQNHTSSTTYITVTVLPIPTELRVFNGTDMTTSFSGIYNENITITLQLYDTLSGVTVPGVLMSSAYGSITLTGINDTYELELNASAWGSIGVKQFTVQGSRVNYVSSANAITVNVQSITTNAGVFINGNDRTSTLQATIDYLDSFNLTVFYNDSTNSEPVTGATVELDFTNATGTYTFPMAPIGSTGNYSVLLDSGDLGAASQYIFSLTAQKNNFDPVFAKINIFLNPIPTALNVSYNSTARARGETITAVYSDIMYLQVDLISYLEGDLHLDDTNPTVSVSAIVNAEEISAYWDPANASWIIEINTANSLYAMDAGFTHSILLVGEADGYQGDNFNLLVSVSVIPTNISVFIDGLDASTFAGSTVYLQETINITVYYQQDYGLPVHLAPLPGTTGTVSFINSSGEQEFITLFNPPGEDYFNDASFLIDETKMKAGITTFYITAQRSSYDEQQVAIAMNIQVRPSNLTVLVDGLNQAAQNIDGSVLNSTIDISVQLSDQLTGTNLSSATVYMLYTNDWTGTTENVSIGWDAGESKYILDDFLLDIANLKSDEFGKRFQFNFQLTAYDNKTVDFDIKIIKLPISVELNTTGTIGDTLIRREPGQGLTLRLYLFDEITNNSFLNLDNISIKASLLASDYFLTPETDAGGDYTGFFSVQIDPPSRVGNYTIYVDIQIEDLNLRELISFESRTFEFQLEIIELGGPIPTWVFYLLIGIIVALATYFILYQIRFKYPPLVRKIQDLRRVVARGKPVEKIKAPKVKSREENIYSRYSEQINNYSFLQTKDSRFAARKSGYAPVPDESIELEFQMPSLDQEDMPVKGPKSLSKGKAAPRMEPAIPAPKPAPKPPAGPKVKRVAKPIGTPEPAAKPPVPKLVAKRPQIKKPSLKALPKPSVKPIASKKPPTAQPAKPATAKSNENLYQQLVLLEQKRYKAERSLRDLSAKHNKGMISDDEYETYKAKLDGSLEKIKGQISDIRRRLISF